MLSLKDMLNEGKTKSQSVYPNLKTKDVKVEWNYIYNGGIYEAAWNDGSQPQDLKPGKLYLVAIADIDYVDGTRVANEITVGEFNIYRNKAFFGSAFDKSVPLKSVIAWAELPEFKF